MTDKFTLSASLPTPTLNPGRLGFTHHSSFSPRWVMPMYDYTCVDCGKESLIIVTLKQHNKGDVQCPACGSTHLQQHVSSFIAHTTRTS